MSDIDFKGARTRMGYAYRVGMRGGLGEITSQATEEFRFKYGLNTAYDEFFHVRVTGQGEIEVKSPTFVRWISVNDQNTCDICGSLDGTYWILEDHSVYPLNLIGPESDAADRLRFHESNVKRKGECRCRLENIQEDVIAWFLVYVDRNQGIIENRINETIRSRIPSFGYTIKVD